MANELAPDVAAYLNQQGFIREVDPSTGPAGPQGTTAYTLVPANGYNNGQRFPHNVTEGLKDADYDKVEYEGIEYYRIPENTTNTPGRLSHYAQLTGVAELQNAPGGGVNPVASTLEKSADATVAPEAVGKYVDETDNVEEARKTVSEEDQRVGRQVSVSPAREPAEGKLVEGSPEGDSDKSTPPKKNEGQKDVPTKK